MRTFVDKDTCIGCSICVCICPGIYRMDGNGFAEAYSQVTATTEDSVLEAADSCPVRAITIER